MGVVKELLEKQALEKQLVEKQPVEKQLVVITESVEESHDFAESVEVTDVFPPSLIELTDLNSWEVADDASRCTANDASRLFITRHHWRKAILDLAPYSLSSVHHTPR